MEILKLVGADRVFALLDRARCGRAGTSSGEISVFEDVA